ncbi:MAG: preprotein translocase subunit YajC [Oscillospiraceae bacterium]|nr:preprotein translocase subunit YajC [Methanobrevibacter sp.]MDO5139699.1 preprotein translocase subunit YajC [Oscillospiraceae bacterium]
MSGFENYYSFVLLGVMLLMMYFMVIRPQRTREKQQTEMRNSIEVGDGVTTIGGVVGRVVSVKDDTILVETGSDRVKIRLMKWAVQEVEKLDLSGSADKPAKKE